MYGTLTGVQVGNIWGGGAVYVHKDTTPYKLPGRLGLSNNNIKKHTYVHTPTSSSSYQFG